MSDTPQTINGELLRLKRESHGWLVSDLATRACMSVKQIRQLEEGGSSSFYSESVKITSAKKVGAILGLTQDEVFGVVTQALDVAAPDADAAFTEMLSQSPIHEAVSHSHAPTHDVSPVASAQTEQVPTEASTVPSAATAPTPSAVADAPVQNDEPAAAEQKNKTPLGAIVALFVAALAVAAWMRPDTEPVAVEPPPPLQTLPVETPDGAASAASSDAPAVPASAASASTSQAAASSAAVAGASAAVSPAPPATAASASASKPL